MDFLSDGLNSFCAAIDSVDIPVLFCERFDEKSDIWNFTRHTHDCIELVYFLYGSAEVTAATKSLTATFYDVVVYPTGTEHSEHLQYGQHQEIICVWADIPELILPNVIHIQDKDARLKPLFECLHKEYKSGRPSQALIAHYIKAIAILIARRCLEEEAGDDPVERVLLYMHDHMSEHITVGQLASMIYVSESYLSRVFKRRTGMPLMEYLRKIRIGSAKTMLSSSSATVAEISGMVGFRSPKYFCRTFREFTGMSPREFKQSEKKQTIKKGFTL